MSQFMLSLLKCLDTFSQQEICTFKNNFPEFSVKRNCHVRLALRCCFSHTITCTSDKKNETGIVGRKLNSVLYFDNLQRMIENSDLKDYPKSFRFDKNCQIILTLFSEIILLKIYTCDFQVHYFSNILMQKQDLKMEQVK